MLSIVLVFSGALAGFISAVLAASAKIGDLQRGLAQVSDARESWKRLSKDLERKCAAEQHENFVLRNEAMALRAKLLDAVDFLDAQRERKEVGE